eukprot:TRINITY_DN13913_c0_g1_i1.p1 TRINITY_DN13913_c0_g1~~TRINITY_DN13913_c0_g1_i1.p1  ORF type:complete len:506 (-),score=77.41 TRINITY_DN13913_c0_g1_i1:59-1576(-)
MVLRSLPAEPMRCRSPRRAPHRPVVSRSLVVGAVLCPPSLVPHLPMSPNRALINGPTLPTPRPIPIRTSCAIYGCPPTSPAPIAVSAAIRSATAVPLVARQTSCCVFSPAFCGMSTAFEESSSGVLDETTSRVLPALDSCALQKPHQRLIEEQLSRVLRAPTLSLAVEEQSSRVLVPAAESPVLWAASNSNSSLKQASTPTSSETYSLALSALSVPQVSGAAVELNLSQALSEPPQHIRQLEGATTTISSTSFGLPSMEDRQAVKGCKIAGAASALLCAAKLYSSHGAPLTIFRRDFIVSMPQRRERLLRVMYKPRAQFLLNQFDCLGSPQDMRLSDGARRIMEEPNAGGTSVWSEALSFEVLSRMFGAELCQTEMEIRYWPRGSKKTDYSCRIGGQRMGVSVTRAYKFQGVYTCEDARMLLNKKLFGVVVSSANVVKRDKWCKQILHVWAQSVHVAGVVMSEYQKMDASLRSNTVVIITVSHNANWIFRTSMQEARAYSLGPWL